MMRMASVVALLALLATAAAAQTPDATHPGKAIYDRACAACHDKPDISRALPLPAMRVMRLGNIFFALTEGKMKAQAAGLSASERGQLVDFIAGRQLVDERWIARMQCAAPGSPKKQVRGAGLAATPTVTGFGFNAHNERRLTRDQAGIGTADVGGLELAWALVFPRASSMRAQPAVVGDMLYMPVGDEARFFAVDVSGDSPCFKWVYASDTPLRTGAGFGRLSSGRAVLAFADVAAWVHLVDAATGKLLWKKHVGRWDLANTTGTPQVVGNRVYVPISASEINFGGEDNHECCKTHGMFTVLEARNGKTVWTYDTMPDAKPIRDRGDGKMMWGPSGAPIWTSPVADAKRGLIYVGTGEATSAPAADTTDSILALDMRTGSLRWKFQATADDVFLTSCMRRPEGLNCPREGRMLDHDFGASPILATLADGREVLLAGQKSGMLWALDPDSNGKLLWQREFGKGSPIGGIHWGMAVDGQRVFVPIHKFPGPDGTDANQVPGLHAVRIADGDVLWSFTSVADCSGDRAQRVPTCGANIGLSGAATVIDGAVFEGSVDGWLRAFDTQTGKVLWQFDTARSYDGINGVTGHGGAIDNASIIATNGYVFVNSGYGLMGGQRPGNVFLAFKRPARTP
jgi:polyvinyl alcohol dehydrogenase (cytochrome)